MSLKKPLILLALVSTLAACEDNKGGISAEALEQIQEVKNHEVALEDNSTCSLNKTVEGSTHTFVVRCATVKYASPKYDDGEYDEVLTDIDYISNHLDLINSALENPEIVSTDDGFDFDGYKNLLASMLSRLNSRERVLRSAIDDYEVSKSAYEESVQTLSDLGLEFEFDEVNRTVGTKQSYGSLPTIDLSAPPSEIEESAQAFISYRENLIELIAEVQNFTQIAKNYSETKYGDDFEKRLAQTESGLSEDILPSLNDQLELVDSLKAIYEVQIALDGMLTLLNEANELARTKNEIDALRENQAQGEDGSASKEDQTD